MQKGFTLIELISVVIILGIILVIAVPQMLNVIELSREKSKLNQIELVKRATASYINDMKNNNENISKYITLETLIKQGYLTDLKLSGVIKTETLNNELIFEYLEINNESGEIVYVDNTKTLKSIIIEGNSTQESTETGKNMIPTNFEHWENGHYNITTGEKENYNDRIRIPYLIEVVPSTSYYFNIYNETVRFIVRSYDASGNFIRNKSTINNGIMNSSSDEYYFGISLHNIAQNEYEIGFNNKTILPTMYLNIEENKTFEEFIPKKPSLIYPSDVKSIENSKLIVETCNIFDFNSMSLTNSQKIDNLISFNQLKYDRILYSSQWIPKESTEYTLVIDIIENTFDKNIRVITDDRFYFLTNFGEILPNQTGRVIFYSKTREDFSNVTQGSLWFWTQNSVVGTFKIKLGILEGKLTEDEIYNCENPTKREIEIPTLRGFDLGKDIYNINSGEYKKVLEKNIITSSASWNDWTVNTKRVLRNSNPTKKVGVNSLGASNVATVKNNSMGGIDTIGIFNLNSASYWYPDWIKMGLKSTDLITDANTKLKNWLNSNEIYYIYILENPVIQNLIPLYFDYIKYIYLDSEIEGNIIIEYE